VTAVILGLFGWMFADVLFGSATFVYRDAGHFYHPLLHFVRTLWHSGQVPLWNPYENLGVPLAANPTAGVFYPGSLILLLPIGYDAAYKLYILAHVLLAAGATYRLARHWHASAEAAGAAALAYAFGGSVLFQYANVVFLVGAAWLPLALLAADRMLVERRVGWALALGAVLAMMTLGGDPQMAYHAGLLTAFYAALLWWNDRTKASRADPIAGMTRSRLGLMMMAGITGLILPAVLVIPAREYSQETSRAFSTAPRTIYELPRYLATRPAAAPDDPGWLDGLTCRRMEPGSHHEGVYQFSVGPWRWAEFVWPNVGGRQFPLHRRWFEAIPAEGRVWVPSLYLGLLPLVLAVASMRLRGGDPRTRWLSWSVLLAMLGGLGWYGLGWIAEEIRAGIGGDMTKPGLVGAPFGGVYWLMTVALPGYVQFRYPAKLLVPAALGLSMLAAAGWDRAFGQSSPGVRRALAALGTISLLGMLVFLVAQSWWTAWLSRAEADPLFGPLDISGARADLLAAFAQTALLSLAFVWLLGRVKSGARWVQFAALALVAIDLGHANGWMIATGPSEALRGMPKVAVALWEHEARHGDRQPYRVYRKPMWLPPAWKHQGSADRLIEAARWERDTVFPYHNLSARVLVPEAYGTMMPYDYEVFLGILDRSTSSWGLLGVRYAILPSDRRWPGGVRFERGPDGQVEDASLWQAGAPPTMAWIVHDVRRLTPLESPTPQEIRQRTKEVLLPGPIPWNFSEIALVEAERLKEPGRSKDAGGGPPSRTTGPTESDRDEMCRIIRYEPARVEIAARLARPGLVVLCDQFYPGWQVEVETAGQGRRGATIVRTNRVMRGVWLPAGEHWLVFRYRPASVFWGALVSGLGWLGLAAAVVLGRRRQQCSSEGT